MGGAGRFRPGSASSNPAPAGSNPAPAASRWPPAEGPNTPHIALGNGRDEAGIRRVKQLGVTYVMGAGGVGPAGGGHGQGPRQLPWQEADLRAGIARARENGLTLYNIMLENSFPNTIYGRPGRDEEIDKIRQTIRAAGKAGLPVIEYNWYAHRAMEGYFEETGRAGLGHTGFDYEKMRGLPPLEEDRIVVSADSDFGTILASPGGKSPIVHPVPESKPAGRCGFPQDAASRSSRAGAGTGERMCRHAAPWQAGACPAPRPRPIFQLTIAPRRPAATSTKCLAARRCAPSPHP